MAKESPGWTEDGRWDEAVIEWNEQKVVDWLHTIKCGQYGHLFETNHMTGQVLLECEQHVLKELGVSKVGDRIRILMGIRSLRAKLAEHHEQWMDAESPYLLHAASLQSLYSNYYKAPSLSHQNSRDFNSPGMPPRTDEVDPVRSQAHSKGVSGHQKASPSTDGVNILSIDTVKQNCVKFIGDEGQTRIVNICGCYDAASILRKALKKYNQAGSHERWCVYILNDRAMLERLTDAELVFICHEPLKPERERLILCQINAQPSIEATRRAHEIFEQQSGQSQSFLTKSSSFGRKKSLTTERPTTSVATRVSTQTQSHLRHTTKRIREFFGQRPPSELISSNLAEYFPDQDKNVLEETVRNSIRNSVRFGAGGRRFSVATCMSQISDTDVPPLPNVADAWLSNTPSSVAATFLNKPPSRPPRPTSLVRVVPAETLKSSSITESITKHIRGSDDFISNRAKNTADRQFDQIVGNTICNDDSKSVSQVESQDNQAQENVDDYKDEHTSKIEFPELLDGSELNDGRGLTKWIRGAFIGSGSFGSVYLGMSAYTGEFMAVKQVEIPSKGCLNSQRKVSMIEALQREILLLRELRHENIVQYLGSNVQGKFFNIFLEYVPGGSVAGLLAYGAFEEPLIRNFVRQVISGLEYLHSRDIVHRDIKGANILVDNKGVIKISDFGISKKVEANLLTATGANRPSLQGSVYWMAPEVVKQTSYTRKADIWSLGCLVIEMFTASHPFPDFSQMQAIFKIGTFCTPDIPKASTSEAKDFLKKTFEIDHNKRPTASELAKHPFLENIVEENTLVVDVTTKSLSSVTIEEQELLSDRRLF